MGLVSLLLIPLQNGLLPLEDEEDEDDVLHSPVPAVSQLCPRCLL